MKKHSKTRKHPPPEFDLADLRKLYDTQGGLCHYLNIPMNVKRCDGNAFNISQERISNAIHYTTNNTVFICGFLQVGGPHDISATEIRDIIYYDQRTDNYVFDGDALKALFYKGPKPGRPNGETKPLFDDDGKIVSKSCTVCNTSLSVDMFYDGATSCKACSAAYNTEYKNTPHGFVKKMIMSAKGDAIFRGKKRKRNDTSDEVDDDLFDIVVNMILKQSNRCAITGIPFIYRMNNVHAPSICRIDKSRGYTADNFDIIVSPLNTTLKPPNEVFAKIRADHFNGK